MSKLFGLLYGFDFLGSNFFENPRILLPITLLLLMKCYGFFPF